MTFPSVYEMFNPLTTVAKQRAWWWFSGNTASTITSGFVQDIHKGLTIIDNVSSATQTYGCDDTADGGFKLTTGAGDTDMFQLDDSFNHVYENWGFDNVAWIAVAKIFQTTEIQMKLGLKDDSSSATNRGNITWECDTDINTNYNFRSTNNAQSGDYTDSTTAIDTNWHTFKGLSNGTNSKGYLDGVLSVINTGTQPDQKKALSYSVKNLSASSRSIAIRYLEIWNT